MNRKLTNIFLVVLIIIAVGISGMWANELINGYNPDKYITVGKITPQDAVKGTPETVTDEAVNKKIAEYRLEESIERTKTIRPDLYEKWVASHPEYFELKEKKRLKEEAKRRKAERKKNACK